MSYRKCYANGIPVTYRHILRRAANKIGKNPDSQEALNLLAAIHEATAREEREIVSIDDDVLSPGNYVAEDYYEAMAREHARMGHGTFDECRDKLWKDQMRAEWAMRLLSDEAHKIRQIAEIAAECL